VKVPLESRQFQRILLIKPSALGDVIHTVPVLAKLRQRYPEARIDWMLNPGIADWVGHHPAISNVLLFDRKGIGRSGGGWKSLARLVKQLRDGKYDLVIDLHGQLRSAFFTAVTGAPVRIGFDRPRKKNQTSARNLPEAAYRHGWTGAREISWIAYSHPIAIPTLEAHAVDRYLWLGQMLGLPAGAPDFHVPIPQEAANRVAEILRQNAIADRPLLTLGPGTVWETKHWRPEGFAGVAKHFLAKGWGVALIGSAGDRKPCAEVARLCPGVVDLSGQTKVSELAALIQRSSLCVTNDSGPMHLAVAVDRPVLGIFGPTDSLWIGPYGRPEAVVSLNLPCSPCYLRDIRECPYGHACMRDLSAAEVIRRAEELLIRQGSPVTGPRDAGTVANGSAGA
jgi:lipopolysaccharide heptosyltransferase I